MIPLILTLAEAVLMLLQDVHFLYYIVKNLSLSEIPFPSG
jgi:hypothetical protein